MDVRDTDIQFCLRINMRGPAWRDDAHAKIGGVGTWHSGGRLIAIRAPKQAYAPLGFPVDSQWVGHALGMA